MMVFSDLAEEVVVAFHSPQDSLLIVARSDYRSSHFNNLKTYYEIMKKSSNSEKGVLYKHKTKIKF